MNRSIGVAIPLALVLLMFLVFIACTSGPTNSNQAPSNGESVAGSPAPPGLAPKCSPGDTAANRVTAMRLHYSNANNANSGDPDLELQRNHGFFLEFDEIPGNVAVLRVKGKIASTDNGAKKPHLDKLIKKYEWYLKHGCADKISFESTTALADPGFEWNVCSGTQVACPNGTCAEPGHCTPFTNTNSGNVGNGNGNTNANSNVNTNSNSNSNTNRAANARSSP